MDQRRSNVGVGRAGFTLIELMVVITTVSTLLGLLLPALSRAAAGARDTKCLSNLSQIARAVAAYRAVPPHLLPLSADALELPDAVWVCPGNRAPEAGSYAYAHPFQLDRMRFSQRAWSNQVDALDGGHVTYVRDATDAFHGHINAGFLDGRAGRMGR